MHGAGMPAEPVPEQHYYAVEELSVPAAPQSTQVGAVGEFLVATKAASRTPTGAAPDTVQVQLFVKDRQPQHWEQPRPVLLLCWRCPGEDEFGPKHEVCVCVCGLSVCVQLNKACAALHLHN